MTKESFLASVALHDKTKGNYKHTLEPNTVEERNERLWNADGRFISLYEYLNRAGYNVFVYEILGFYKKIDWSKRNKKRKSLLPAPRSMGRFAHMYIPELNLAIRFTFVEHGEYDKRLGQFIHQSRDYVYTCVINPSDDVVEKFRSVRDKVKEYARGDSPKKGIARTLVVPERKKRARITTTQKA